MSVLECRVERESFTDREVRELIAAARCDEREKVAAFMLAHSIATGHGDTIEDLLTELGGEIAALRQRCMLHDDLEFVSKNELDAARQNERERCRDRINALIAAHVAMSERHQTVPGRRWYEARLATLIAARSAVMRGDDDGAPPVQ